MTENANRILPRLWLGNKQASMDSDFFTRNNIAVVFNCTKDLPFLDPNLRNYRVPVDDNLENVEIANMKRWAPEIVYKLLSEYNSGKTILVHCYAGIQRSAAVTAMALLALTHQPAIKIIEFIRSKRPIAFFPKANFAESIFGFEQSFQAHRALARQ